MKPSEKNKNNYFLKLLEFKIRFYKYFKNVEIVLLKMKIKTFRLNWNKIVKQLKKQSSMKIVICRLYKAHLGYKHFK